MIKFTKGFNALIDAELPVTPTDWYVVGSGSPMTLSGVTYDSGQITVPSASLSEIPVGDYLMVAAYNADLYEIGDCIVRDLKYEKSHARTVLEALQATLEGRATKEQTEVQVAGRMVKYLSLAELMTAISQYKRLAEQEERQNSLTSSGGFNGIIRTRWGS